MKKRQPAVSLMEDLIRIKVKIIAYKAWVKAVAVR